MTEERRRGRRPAVGKAVLDRAFGLLGAFTINDTALTLTQLSNRTATPLSSTLRLATQLCALGALERRPNGAFTIGIRMLEYASLAPRGHGLRAIALPYMEDLHRATRQHVQLAVREGDVGVIVERLSANDAGKVLYRVGSRIPLHGTGLGLVLLAHATPAFQDAYLATERVLEPENTPLVPSELRRRLQHVRTTGVARFSRTLPERAETVAAPIFDRTATCVASLSVLGAHGSLNPGMVEPALVAISRAVSRELSRSGTPPASDVA